MKIFLRIFFLFVLANHSVDLNAQGCSDAGFCTIGNLDQHHENTSAGTKQKLSIILSNGVGDEHVYVFTPAIQYDNELNKHWAIQAKLTANYANGNLGNATGPGDAFLTAIYNISKTKKWQTSFLLGIKIPLNNGDIHEESKPLPMQYQSSLGTIDILAGVSVKNLHWLFATAIQQPLTGTNRNTFLPVYWNTAKADAYIPTNDFKRKGDVLLKAAYTFNTEKKLLVTTGLLGIYHLGRDTYINGNVSNNPIELKGSNGLTLNATASGNYKINNKFSLGLSAGVPFVVRDIRPDGLTREFVLSPEFIFHF